MNHREKKGFTLIEAMLAVTILGIAAAGVLLPFASGASLEEDGKNRTLSAKLAGDLLEKIVSKPAATIMAAPGAGGYNGYSEAQGQIKDDAGNLFTGAEYAKFSRQVTCSYVYMPQQAGSSSANFVLVTVSVSYDSKPMVTLKRLVSG